MSQQKIIIIGAGIGGIATANLLAKAGYLVEVFEKNAASGGRAGTASADGFTFDTGPSWYLMPEVFEQYYRLLGTTTDKELSLVRLSPAYKVFFEQQPPVIITGDAAIDEQTFEAIETGAGKKLQRYIEDGNNVYRLSLKHFLYTNFLRPTELVRLEILRSGLSLLRRATTNLHRYVAKSFRDQRLQQILEYPMVFLGSSPYQAPAIYSLMSALDFREGVFYPQGGMYTIIESLMRHSQALGVQYHFNQPVTEILTQRRRAMGVKTADNKTHTADIVISNADLHFTETVLVPEQDRSFPAHYWKRQQAGPSALLMYLGVSGQLPTLQHHNLFFVDDWKKNFEAIYDDRFIPKKASIYICKPSATDPSVAPSGSENVFVLVPLPADTPLSASQLETYADRYLEQIERMTGVNDLRSRITYRRLFGPNEFSDTFNAWQGTALGPSHILKQSALFRTPNKSKRLDNLYYTGGFTVPGIGLPMCLIGAELVYKRVIRDNTGGPLHSIAHTKDQA